MKRSQMWPLPHANGLSGIWPVRYRQVSNWTAWGFSSQSEEKLAISFWEGRTGTYPKMCTRRGRVELNEVYIESSSLRLN